MEAVAEGLFLEKLTADRQDVFSLPFDRVPARAGPDATLFEYIHHDRQYVPYTDTDHYCETPDRPDDAFIERVFDAMFDNLNQLVGPQGYEGCRLRVATRHGLCTKKKVYKLSFRCYLCGFVITPADMKRAIQRKGLDKVGLGSFDVSPYNKTQLLGCVGFRKTKQDGRVLLPYHRDDPLENYLVQNLTGEERDLKFLEDPPDAESVVGQQGEQEEEDETDDNRFAPPWDLVELLIQNLSIEHRCGPGTYEAWTRIGWALANVARAAGRFQEGLKLWLDFCQKSTHAFLDDIRKGEEIYRRAERKRLGWRSLMAALKEDSSAVHRKIVKKLVAIERKDRAVIKGREQTVTVLSEEEARQRAFELMTECKTTGVPKEVNLDGMTLESLEKCNLGWNCNLPKNRWINGKEIEGRGGGIDILLGWLGVQLVNVQSDPFNPWPKDGWPVDPRELQKVLGHVTFNNCVFNKTITNNQIINGAIEQDILLPSEFTGDGLDQYSHDEELRELFLLSLNGEHTAVAKYFHAIKHETYRCLAKTWYEFSNHIWNGDSDGNDVILADLSSKTFLAPFVRVLDFYRDTGCRAPNAEYKGKRVQNLLSQLQTGPFKGHVLGECGVQFRSLHRDFRDTLDQAYLTPFANGVLDLKTLTFRDGLPADNMSKSMLVDCVLYDPETPHPEHLEILQWFEEVQPDDSLRNYVQKLVGLLLTPDTDQQKVWVLSGLGQNGKSFFINKILKPAMGSFYGTGATTLLTQKREKANETNEALMDLIGKRVVVFNEPASNEVIQADTLKVISGEDEMTVRANYGKQTRFTPTFKTFIICNDRPKMSEDSYAVWRRVRVIDWPMKFTKTPNPEAEMERRLDPLLEEKRKRWPPFFAGLMVHWLQRYRNDGLDEPDCLTQHTRQYEEEHDEWAEFRASFLQADDDVCGLTQLKEAFKPWFKSNCGAKTPPDAALKTYFSKHLGGDCRNHKIDVKKTRYGWKGWRLLNPDPNSRAFVPE